MIQRRRQQPAVPEAVPLPVAPAPHPTTARQVRVIAGADVQDMELAGRPVAEARAVAQAMFGIHPEAVAVVDGDKVGEDHLLGDGQVLEFVKYAGKKGAAAEPAGGPIIELSEDRAVWRRQGKPLGTLPVSDLLARAAVAGEARPSWRLHPRLVRLMVARGRGHVVGVVIEMPPGPRQVEWIADDSPAPYGPDGRYDTRRLSFPWVVLVLVLVDGELTNLQQAFYRTAPLTSLDDELCYTNLLNVARGYEQESWVCLANLDRALGRLGWDERVLAVTDHFWHASFTRSSEIHERNSFWGTSRRLDRRLETPAAWEEATRASPYFTLEVRWRRAPRPLGATLERMLDRVAPCRPIERVEHLVTLMQMEGC